MKVTVLLPVYNAGSPLRLALESLIQQSYSDYEVLVIDDKSMDGSLAIIREFEKRSPLIRVIAHETNRGLATTLNEGLALARGEYVARMDQDDESLPSRLETQVAFLDANPDYSVVGSFTYHMGATRARDRLVTLPTGFQEIADTLPNYNCLYHPATMLRRKAILDIGGYREAFRNAEDYDLWLRVSRVSKLENIPEPLLRYRFTTGGMTLGRKWQQMYYVYMAQAAHRNPEASIDALNAEAKALIDGTDRAFYFSQVLEGTLRELISLHLWADAYRLVWAYRHDVGRSRARREFVSVSRNFWNALMGRQGSKA
jgi:glycosyltransferase involved in cell wall biosynthesis